MLKNLVPTLCKLNQKQYYSVWCHTKYEPTCKDIIKIKSLKSSPSDLGDTNVKTNFCMSGEDVQLEYYDSHFKEENLKFTQSSLPTVLLLPSSEHTIDEYSYLIGSLAQEKFRVLALRFPGFGNSRILDKDTNYDSSVIQKTVLVQDFLLHLLYFRKNPLNMIIGFNDNSHLLAMLNSSPNSKTYMGHKSLILVNPSPPNFIAKLSLSKLDLFLDEKIGNKMIRNKVLNQIQKLKKQSDLSDTEKVEMFYLFQSWSFIDENWMDFSSVNLIPDYKKSHIFLYDNELVYDRKYNDYMLKYFSELNGFKNIYQIAKPQNEVTDLEHILLAVTRKCVDILKR